MNNNNNNDPSVAMENEQRMMIRPCFKESDAREDESPQQQQQQQQQQHDPPQQERNDDEGDDEIAVTMTANVQTNVEDQKDNCRTHPPQQLQQQQQQVEHLQQQVQALLEAIRILSQLAQMDTARYLQTRNSSLQDNDQKSNSNHDKRQQQQHHALVLQQRLDQLGQQWKLEDTDIPSLNHAIHKFHSHTLEYQTQFDQQELELRRWQEHCHHMEHVILPKYQRKLVKYKQRAKTWQQQYHQQHAQRKSILKVAKDYIQHLHCGTAQQLAQAQMAYQVQAHEHAMKQQSLPGQTTAATTIFMPNESHTTATATTTKKTTTTNTPSTLAKRLSFRKQKTPQTQQPPSSSSSSSLPSLSTTIMNRMRTFSKESTASSDLSDGLDFQYYHDNNGGGGGDQDDVGVLDQLNEFDDLNDDVDGDDKSKSPTGSAGQGDLEEEDGFSVHSSSSSASSSTTCSLVTDQGVATLQLAPKLLHSSISISAAATSTAASKSQSSTNFSSPMTAEKSRFSSMFHSSSSPSVTTLQPPLQPSQQQPSQQQLQQSGPTSMEGMPIYTIDVAVGSLWFCKVPVESTNLSLPTLSAVDLPPLPPTQPQKSAKATPKGLISLEPTDDQHGHGDKKDRTCAPQDGLSMSHHSNHGFQSSMKSLGLGGLLTMGKHSQHQQQTPQTPDNTTAGGATTMLRSLTSSSSSSKQAVAVAAPEYAFLVCGFQDSKSTVDDTQELGFSSSAHHKHLVRPTFGARLLAVAGQNLFVTEYMTLQDLQKIVQANIKPSQEGDEEGPSLVTMSFRNDILTKAQQQMLDKAVAEKQRIMAATALTNPLTSSVASIARLSMSLPLTGSDNKELDRSCHNEREIGEASQRQPNVLLQSFFKLTSLTGGNGEAAASPDVSNKLQVLNDSSISDLSWVEAPQFTENGTPTTTTSTLSAATLRGMKLPLFLKPKQLQGKAADDDGGLVTEHANESNSSFSGKQPGDDEIHEPASDEYSQQEADVNTSPSTSTNLTSSVMGIGFPSFLKPKPPENKNETEVFTIAATDAHDDSPTTDSAGGSIKDGKDKIVTLVDKDSETSVHQRGENGDQVGNEEVDADAIAESVAPLTAEANPLKEISSIPVTVALNTVPPELNVEDKVAVSIGDKSSSQSPENGATLRGSEHANQFHTSMKQVGSFFSGFRVAD